MFLILRFALIFATPFVTMTGSDHYPTRERGEQSLEKLSLLALPAIWKGEMSQDLEIRRRCRGLASRRKAEIRASFVTIYAYFLIFGPGPTKLSPTAARRLENHAYDMHDLHVEITRVARRHKLVTKDRNCPGDTPLGKCDLNWPYWAVGFITDLRYLFVKEERKYEFGPG